MFAMTYLVNLRASLKATLMDLSVQPSLHVPFIIAKSKLLLETVNDLQNKTHMNFVNWSSLILLWVPSKLNL